MPVYFIHSIPFMGKVPHNVRRKGRRHFLQRFAASQSFSLCRLNSWAAIAWALLTKHPLEGFGDVWMRPQRLQEAFYAATGQVIDLG